MGSANVKSTVTNSNQQLFISESLVNVLNKNTNEAVANALIQNNNSCISTKSIYQLLDFSGCKVTGNLTIGNVNQQAVIVVDFSCLNTAKAQQSMAQSMLSELINTAQSTMNATSFNTMNTASEALAKQSGIFGGSASTNTNVNNKFNLKQVNSTNTNIQNVVANSITSNFTVKNIQKCIDDAKIAQAIQAKNCSVGGNLTVENITQSASIEAVVNCVNKSGAINDVITDVANKLNIAVVSDSKIAATSDMKNVLKSQAESTGLSLSSCPGCDSSGMSIWLIFALCILCILASSSSIFFGGSRNSSSGIQSN